MTFTAASAQQYFYKSVDFSDSVGRRYIHQVEAMSAILLKGYLDGQLKAYRFCIRSEDVKWKPLEPWDMPPQWDPQMIDYYTEDKVTYNGKFYEAMKDSPAKPGFAPPKPEYWKEYEILGEPVSTIHSWPTAKDTTSKAEFLEGLVEYNETHLDQVWLTGEDLGGGYYNGGDVYAYKGKYYECQMDHRASQRGPDVDTENWLPTKPRVTFHLPTDEINVVAVCYWREGIGTGRLIPQMLTLIYPSYNRFVPRSGGLNFFYSDIVDYLASRQQLPLLHQPNLGYIGTPQLMLGADNSKLLRLVQENMNLALKPSRKNIVDATKYESFLRARSEELSSSIWSIVQDMITNDLIVTARENSPNGPNYVPVLKIPWKAMEKILISNFTPLGPQPKQNYLDWIDDYTSRYEREPEPVDTLEAKVREPLAIPVPMSTYFLEDRFALAVDNAVMNASLESLWTALKRAVNTKQMKLRTKEFRLFRADKPFPEVTFNTSVATWILEKGFQLESEPELVMDSAAMVNPPIGIHVVYKRQVTAEKSKTPLFEPVKLAVVVFDQKINDYRGSWFLWEDVTRVGGLPPDIRKLFMAVKEGTLMFDDAEVVYGLVGEK